MSRKGALQIVLVLIALVFFSFAVVASANPGPSAKDNRVIIYRDNYGVPHIYADRVYDLFYGYGYCVAVDRLFQMEMSKRTMEGTVAEALGPAPLNPAPGQATNYVAYDKGIRSNYSPASIQAQYDALSKYYRDIFEGYAAGINARVDEVLKDSALLPKQFTDYDGILPTKWTPLNVVMIFVGSIVNRFSDFNSEIDNLNLRDNLITKYGNKVAMDIFTQVKWINDPGAPTTVPLPKKMSLLQTQTPKVALAPSTSIPVKGAFKDQAENERRVLSRFGLEGLLEAPKASNLWMVNGNKTHGKSAILFNGPQFGWFNPGYVYEVGLHGAGFDVVGSSPFAYPAIFFGHNNHIAWGSTAGVGDVVDMYQEQACGGDQYHYLYQNQCLAMEKRTDIIKVKGQPDQTVDIYRTLHGFVTFDTLNNRIFSKKRSWEGYEVAALVAWIDSMRASNYQEWRNAASKVAITINWYYADREGNIAYIHTGKYPIRPQTQDPRVPAIGTGVMEWLGIHPFEWNAQVVNPKQDFITNWNNKSAIYENDADFQTWGSADRVNEIIAELQSHKKFTPEEVWEMNRRISFADLNRRYFLPFVLDAVRKYGQPGSAEVQAANLLTPWSGYRADYNADGYYDSPGQTIFQTWLATMLGNTFNPQGQPVLGQPWTNQRLLGTGYPAAPPTGSTNLSTGSKVLYHALLGSASTVPNNYDFFKGVDPLLVVFQSLTGTISSLTTKYGTADMNKWLLPVIAQEFFFTNYNGIPQADSNENLFLPIQMNRGTENHMVVLDHKGVSGVNVCPPGESGFVSPQGVRDPHYDDQMELYKTFGSKPMLFYPDAVTHQSGVQVLEVQ